MFKAPFFVQILFLVAFLASTFSNPDFFFKNGFLVFVTCVKGLAIRSPDIKSAIGLGSSSQIDTDLVEGDFDTFSIPLLSLSSSEFAADAFSREL